jgi:hypothetical protein
MEQETGIRSLYVEFFPGYGTEIGLFCPNSRPNSAHKRTYARSSEVAGKDLLYDEG